jgi:DNA polymerase-3 subunit chi
LIAAPDMTRIDFYVLQNSDSAARFDYACRLAEKAFKLGNQVHIHTANAEQAKQLDQWLWHYEPSSFLPHSLAINASGQREVIISHEPPAHNERDVLINLDQNVPSFFSQFERVAEIVIQDEAALTALRNNWLFYKNRNYPLTKHDIGARAK